MNNKLLRLLLLTLASFLAIQNSSGQDVKKENPYGLDIISTMSQYNKSVTEDPENALVDLQKYIPGIVLDIRYATTDNFAHKKIYTQPKAYLRKPAADSLLTIQKILAKKGLGIKVYDAYRPYSGTLCFYRIYPDTTFVAAPWKGSIHNRGCAIDLSIIDLSTGVELDMPTPFDSFSEKASHNCRDITPKQMKNRELLCKIMTGHGFSLYDAEWWHYNFKERAKFKLMDISFEELNK